MHYGNKGSAFSWDEASYDSQNSEYKSVTIDHIPTAIEYLSSSSIDQSLEAAHDHMEVLSRYSVPMEVDQQQNVIEEQSELKHSHLYNDTGLDKYSVIDQEFEKCDEDDDDDDKSTLFGSLANDSFVSDTALRDEINTEREKIKQSFMQANEKSKAVKRTFFNVSDCFGPASTSTNSHSYLLDSPIKKPYAVRYKLESDQFLRLE